MTRVQFQTTAFRLEEGECVAGCFEIRHWDASDHPWFARAIHQPTQECVQLAVQVRGPWSSPQDKSSSDLDWSWPDSRIPGMLPIVIHTQVPHGGGILDIAITPDLPPAFSSAENPTPRTASNTLSSDDNSEEPRFLTAPTWLPHGLNQLDRLYRFSLLIEEQHEVGFAHGALTRASFRVDPKGQPHLRPALGNFSGREGGDILGWSINQLSLDPDKQTQDLAALWRLAGEILAIDTDSLDAETLIHQWLPPDCHHSDLFQGLVKIVSQPCEETPNSRTVLNWRASLDQLIQVIEAAWLTDTAYENRQVMLKRLLAGDTQAVLHQGDTSPDPWCIELATALRKRRDQTTEAYHQWQLDQRDLPVQTSTEQLLDLMQRGYSLPEPPPFDAMQRRLTGSIHHLREAASAMRRRDWPRTHFALSAASSLDPTNTTLAGLGAITAQLVNQRKETTHA
jgi:hypothetical protein